jgi:hypothetical protein
MSAELLEVLFRQCEELETMVVSKESELAKLQEQRRAALEDLRKKNEHGAAKNEKTDDSFDLEALKRKENIQVTKQSILAKAASVIEKSEIPVKKRAPVSPRVQLPVPAPRQPDPEEIPQESLADEIARKRASVLKKMFPVSPLFADPPVSAELLAWARKECSSSPEVTLLGFESELLTSINKEMKVLEAKLEAKQTLEIADLQKIQSLSYFFQDCQGNLLRFYPK